MESKLMSNREIAAACFVVALLLAIGFAGGWASAQSGAREAEERGRQMGKAEAMEWLMSPDPACQPAKPQRFQKGDILIPMERL